MPYLGHSPRVVVLYSFIRQAVWYFPTIFHITDHSVLPSCSSYHSSFPRWSESFCNFLGSRSRSHRYQWVHLSDPAELLFLIFCNHALPSFPHCLASDVPTQQHFQHGSFHSPLCRNQSPFFFIAAYISLAYNIVDKNSAIEEIGMQDFAELSLQHHFYCDECIPLLSYLSRDLHIQVSVQIHHPP